jgi:alpha-mannosidase
MLFKEDPDSFVLANTLSYVWKGSVKVPESFEGYELLGPNDDTVQVQKTDEGVMASVDLEPLSFTTFKKGKTLTLDGQRSDDLLLENDLIKYVFDGKGSLISTYDKKLEKEFMSGPGNVLSLYEDRPNNWDAWDVDFFYRDALIETAELTEAVSLSNGEVINQLRFVFNIGNSTIDQTVSLNPHSKRLDFLTQVDWKESHKMLRVHFPVNIRSDQASFDIQYGHVRRNTHRNTSWDKAKFEVVGHKYADLSDHDNGVALINDCKYGYMVHDDLLDLNLLRSPSNPDPDADKGTHTFTYSLLPHQNDLIHSNVISESSCLNQEPLLFEGMKSEIDIPLKLIGDGLELSVLKKAEKENVWILRVVETHGRVSSGSVQINGEVTECDLMEWNELGVPQTVKGSFELTLDPFEIRTYKITY